MNLLLHMCCGPCSCYPVKKLRQEGIEPVGYFFNPNIHPYKEWDMRLKTAREFAAKVDMKMYDDDNYRLRDFLRRALAAEAVKMVAVVCAIPGGWRKPPDLQRSRVLMLLLLLYFTVFISSMS